MAIDREDSELDGATVPILYEGRTADGLVKDAPGLDQLFEDMFQDYIPDEIAVIKAKYATEGDVLEAPLLIEQKARDMIRHYVGLVLPEGFKAEVVATSRQAAVTYYEKLEQARRELVAELEAVPAATLALPDDDVEKLDPATRSSYVPIRSCPSCAYWKRRSSFLGITTTLNHGGTGPTKTSRMSGSSGSKGSWRRRKRKKQTRCRFC